MIPWDFPTPAVDCSLYAGQPDSLQRSYPLLRLRHAFLLRPIQHIRLHIFRPQALGLSFVPTAGIQNPRTRVPFPIARSSFLPKLRGMVLYLRRVVGLGLEAKGSNRPLRLTILLDLSASSKKPDSFFCPTWFVSLVGFKPGLGLDPKSGLRLRITITHSYSSELTEQGIVVQIEGSLLARFVVAYPWVLMIWWWNRGIYPSKNQRRIDLERDRRRNRHRRTRGLVWVVGPVERPPIPAAYWSVFCPPVEPGPRV